MLESLVVVAIVLAALVFVVIKIVGISKGKSGCCGGGSTSGCGSCKVPNLPGRTPSKEGPDEERIPSP